LIRIDSAAAVAVASVSASSGRLDLAASTVTSDRGEWPCSSSTAAATAAPQRQCRK
jgi:hypothetical protein